MIHYVKLHMFSKRMSPKIRWYLRTYLSTKGHLVSNAAAHLLFLYELSYYGIKNPEVQGMKEYNSKENERKNDYSIQKKRLEKDPLDP